MPKPLTALQTKTLAQITASPGHYKMARCQTGFSLTSATSLWKRGLVACDRRDNPGSPWARFYPVG